MLRTGNKTVLLCLLSWFLSAAPGYTSTQILIDDFDRGGGVSAWTFSNGPEFPGATGSLTLGQGRSGNGAHLSYDFSGRGKYVRAVLTLSPARNGARLSFWVKSPPGVKVGFRVLDASGQTLIFYTLNRPLPNFNPTNWYHQGAHFGAPGGWYGGANDGKLHNPISQISIVALPYLPGAVGSLDFDDVSMSTNSVVDLDPLQPLIPAPLTNGAIFSRFGVQVRDIDWNPNYGPELDAAHALGFSFIRETLIWPHVEHKAGVYDWTAYDALVSSIESRGMGALFMLQWGNYIYTGDDFQAPPTNAAQVQAYANYAQAAATHYAGHNVKFEVWNEPNLACYWPPGTNPCQYATVAQQAISKAHQAQPNAQLVTAGLSTLDFLFETNFLSCCGGRIGANAIGLHPYNHTGLELLTDGLLVYADNVGKYLSNAPPVWITENGYSSVWFGDGLSQVARNTQATLVARELLTGAALGYPLFTFYMIRDTGVDSTNYSYNYGLLANDYSQKPAYRAVQTLASVAQGRSFSGFIDTALSSLTAMRFDGQTDQVFAVWSTATNQTTITVPTNAIASDLFGVPITLQNWTNRLMSTLSATSGPVYISFAATPQGTNSVPLAPAQNLHRVPP